VEILALLILPEQGNWHRPDAFHMQETDQERNIMAGIFMWLMGVPLVVIVLLYLIF